MTINQAALRELKPHEFCHRCGKTILDQTPKAVSRFIVVTVTPCAVDFDWSVHHAAANEGNAIVREASRSLTLCHKCVEDVTRRLDGL